MNVFSILVELPVLVSSIDFIIHILERRQHKGCDDIYMNVEGEEVEDVQKRRGDVFYREEVLHLPLESVFTQLLLEF